MLATNYLKHIFLTISTFAALMSIVGSCALAQHSVYTDPFALYRDAEELFAQEKYGASQRKFGEYLQAVGANQSPMRAAIVPNIPSGNDKIAQARYFQTLCGFRLHQQDAEPQLQQFLAAYPNFAQANVIRFSLGKLYFDAGNYQPAIQVLRDAISREGLSPDMTEEAEFMLGYAFLQVNDLPSATAYLEKAAQKQTVWREKAQYYHSVLLYRQGDYSGAYEAFQDVRKSKIYGKEIQVYLANCLLQLQRYEELSALADEVEKEGIQDPQVYYIVANAAFEEDNFEEASENYLLYSKSKGTMTRADQFRYGYAMYQEEEYKKAFDIFMNVITTDNDSLAQASNYYMGFCAYQQKSYEVARSAFNKASQMTASPIIRQDALLYYAKTCLQSEFYEDALKALKQYEKEYPKSPQIEEVKGLIGELMLYTSNYPEAITYLESIPRNSARTKEAYQSVTYNYALMQFKSGSYAEAEKLFRKCISVDVDHNKTLSAYYWIAEGKFLQKQYGAALDSYRTYMAQSGAKKHENYAMGFYGLAWANFEMKNYSSSEKDFEEFIAFASKSADATYVSDAYIRAGDCCFLKRDYAKAETYYASATKLTVGTRDYAQYQIGECEYRQQKYTASVSAFDVLIRTYRTTELYDDALNRMASISLDWLQDTARSQIYDRRLTQEFPKSPFGADARIRMGYTLASKDPQVAIDYLNVALVNYPEDDKNCQLALDALRVLLADQPDRFNRIEQEYLAKVPNGDQKMAQAQFNWGKEKFLQGDLDAAISELSSYISKYPNGENIREARLYRARAYDRQGKTSLAQGDYNVILSAKINDAVNISAMREVAELSYRLGEYAPAMEFYKQMEAATDKPALKAQAQFGQADCYLKMADYSTAVGMFRALAENEDLLQIIRTKARLRQGQALLYKGDLPEALTLFQQAEDEFDGEQAAEAQYWVVATELERFRFSVTTKGNLTVDVTENAVRKILNDYSTYNYWKARSFLALAELYILDGNTYQGRYTLESLITDERFPDIKQQAQAMLKELNNQ